MHALPTLDWWLFRLLFGLATLAVFLLAAVAIRAAEWLIERIGCWHDEDALARLVERQIAAASRGVVVCGSIGEAPSLSDAERALAVRVVVEAAGNRAIVIAGCTASGGTARTVALAEAAVVAGAGALLCAAPPYGRPTQAGIVAHIRAVAHAADRPVVLAWAV